MELVAEVSHKLQNMIFGYIDILKKYLVEPNEWDKNEEKVFNRLPLGHFEYEENITEREELLFYEVLNCYDFSITELNMLLVYIKTNSNYFNIKYSNYDAVFEDGDLTNNDNYDNGYGYYSFLRDVTTIFFENNREMFMRYIEPVDLK